MPETCNYEITPISYTPCIDLPLTPFMDEFIKVVVKKQEEIIIKVLTEVLKREPTTDDFKECQRLVYPHFQPNDYIFAYKNIPLGFIKHEFEIGKATVTFTPYAGNI